MNVRKYLVCFFKDFFLACGCLLAVVTLFLGISSVKTIDTSSLWQIIIIASAYTFFKTALLNKYELEKKMQVLNFTICHLLAEILIIAWLWFFSPNKMVDANLMIAYSIIVILVNGSVYIMMYMNGQQQARQINEKLSQYNNTNEEQKI
jgi:Co/Zn/Cd efflux system component